MGECAVESKRCHLAPNVSTFEGKFVRLESLSVTKHSDNGLRDAIFCDDMVDRYEYLQENPPANEKEYLQKMRSKESSKDPLYFVVIDVKTELVGGYLALQHILPNRRAYEIGNVFMGPSVARTRVATEAVFMLLQYAFNVLNYKRVEWKCNALNVKSRAAAERFGFKYISTYKKPFATKGLVCDTACYMISSEDWTNGVEASYVAWLDDKNFTSDGQQINTLCSFRAPATDAG